MEYDNLIGLPLEKASQELINQGIPFYVTKTNGTKDQNILNQEYVIRVRLNQGELEILTSTFKTEI